MKSNDSPFHQWVRELGGPGQVAALLGVSKHTVIRWFYRYAFPSIDNMTRIIEISDNRLSYNSIITSIMPLVK